MRIVPPFATVEALALCEFRESSAPRESTVTESPEAGKKTGRSLCRKQIGISKTTASCREFDALSVDVQFCAERRCLSVVFRVMNLTGRRQPPVLTATTTMIQNTNHRRSRDRRHPPAYKPHHLAQFFMTDSMMCFVSVQTLSFVFLFRLLFGEWLPVQPSLVTTHPA